MYGYASAHIQVSSVSGNIDGKSCGFFLNSFIFSAKLCNILENLWHMRRMV